MALRLFTFNNEAVMSCIDYGAAVKLGRNYISTGTGAKLRLQKNAVLDSPLLQSEVFAIVDLLCKQ